MTTQKKQMGRSRQKEYLKLKAGRMTEGNHNRSSYLAHGGCLPANPALV